MKPGAERIQMESNLPEKLTADKPVVTGKLAGRRGAVMIASAQARPSAPPAGDAQLMLQAALVYVQRVRFPVFPFRPNKEPYTDGAWVQRRHIGHSRGPGVLATTSWRPDAKELSNGFIR